MKKNWKKNFVHVTLNSSSSSISFEMLFVGFWIIEAIGIIVFWGTLAVRVGVGILEGDFDTKIEWELMWEFLWELVLVFKLEFILEFILEYILVFILEFLSKLEDVIILEFIWEFLSGMEGEFII